MYEQEIGAWLEGIEWIRKKIAAKLAQLGLEQNLVYAVSQAMDSSFAQSGYSPGLDQLTQ
ncbi:hypothetical protein LNV08_12115 [Paucibacter sp. TC2R-5]|uniref:hypothetical protein n=1 Tax=Paucibacter sp. TC2R-5 TaxID=2893555 RepID=UPI0021E4EF92|nr:hypothetical protein [Paucibacter sp. TC2R-5]MCV2359716.1 hypothetical protein [Paucibacter sp. TC2R-5]